MITRFLVLLCVGFFLLNSCKCKKDIPLKDKTEKTDSISYAVLPEEQKNIIQLVYQWNTMHDSANIDSLSSMYSNRVLFYKKYFDSKTVVATKKIRIKNAKFLYRQLIIGRIGIYPSDTGDYKCEFLKLVNIDNHPKVYHTYLVFEKQADNSYKIIVESDKESDLRPDYEQISIFEKFRESSDKSIGDFNGDGENEDLLVIKPQLDSSGNFTSSNTKISFTNFDIPEIEIANCIGVNVLNENDVDGDGSDDFSVVIKRPNGDVGEVVLYSFKRGKWQQLAKFTAPESEVFSARQNLIEFAGSGNIKIREVQKNTIGTDSTVIKTISTW